MAKLTEREVRAALAAEREYRMKVEAEREAARDEAAELRELLDCILNHSVANRGTKDAFFRCHTYNSPNMPEWVKRAEDAIMAVLDK